jgi:hypothetical protein
MAKRSTTPKVQTPVVPTIDDLLGEIDGSEVKSLAASNPAFLCSIEEGKRLANDLMAQHGYTFSKAHVINAGRNGAGEYILLAYLLAPANQPTGNFQLWSTGKCMFTGWRPEGIDPVAQYKMTVAPRKARKSKRANVVTA